MCVSLSSPQYINFDFMSAREKDTFGLLNSTKRNRDRIQQVGIIIRLDFNSLVSSFHLNLLSW